MLILKLNLISICLIIINFNFVHLVDRNNFKQCKDSGFCVRQRQQKVDPNQWQLLGDTITKSYDGQSVEGKLKHLHTGVSLKLELFSLLNDGSVLRMRINEENSQRKRYESKESLLENIVHSKIELDSVDNEKAVIKFGKSYKALLNLNPFHIDVYDNDDLIIIGNQRGLFKFEHYRTRESEQPAGDENKNEEKEKEEGEETKWQETFKSWTDTKPYGPMSVGMDFSFVDFDHVYGIPEHADDFALKSTDEGDPYRLYNLDVFEYETNNPMALYGSYPMMLAHSSRRTVGLLWLNPSETWIDIGKTSISSGLFSNFGFSSDKKFIPTQWISETGVIDVYLMLGPKPADVMKQNAQLVGTIEMPPYYSIGHHQSRWNYFTQDQVNEINDGFDEHDIPVDAIWLDIEYTEGRSKKYFTWDPHSFADPQTLISNLTARGRRLITIIDPHMKKDTDYAVYNEAVQNNFFIKTKNGEDYEGWCWPGASMYPDYSNPAVKEWWSSKFNPEFFPGFAGGIVDIWNDMNEPSVFNGPEITAPKDVVHMDGFEHRDLHNEYGFLMIKATHNGLMTHRPNLRPFILTRAMYVGAQRYAAVWTGDNMSKWDHLKILVPMLLSLSVVGMSFTGADVPGFFYNPESEELVIRWYQSAAFQPFFRAHGHLETSRREPWEFSEPTILAIRSAIQTRYIYLPHMYTLFYENVINGVPVMQPLWFQFPDDVNTFSNADSYMLGDSMLIHPITDKDVTSIKVYFPGKETDTWFDVKANKLYNGGSTSIIQVDLQTIPFYQRGGTIVPKRERMRRSAALTLDDPITLDIVLNTEGSASGRVYLDDGYTFNYKDGKYNYAKINLETDNEVSHINYEVTGNYEGKTWLEKIVIYQMKRKPNVIEGKSNNEPVHLQFRYDQSKEMLIIRKPGFKMNLSWTIDISY